MKSKPTEAEILAVLSAIERKELSVRLLPGEEGAWGPSRPRYETANGWILEVWNDAGEWDYLESVTSPTGEVLDFEEMSERLQDYQPPQQVVSEICKFPLFSEAE